MPHHLIGMRSDVIDPEMLDPLGFETFLGCSRCQREEKKREKARFEHTSYEVGCEEEETETSVGAAEGISQHHRFLSRDMNREVCKAISITMSK